MHSVEERGGGRQVEGGGRGRGEGGRGVRERVRREDKGKEADNDSTYTVHDYVLEMHQQHQLRWLTFSSFQRKSELPQVGFEPMSLFL